jgi:mannose-6-phosphate isomerase
LSVTSSSSGPLRLPTLYKEKVWGRHDLHPLFPDDERKIGEVWFEADLPLLAKFVFTSDKLSVQVHPDDYFAARHEHSLGKTEMWHVVKADAGAQVALGFRKPLNKKLMREAALSGEIEELLRWVDVKAGDTFFVPAGTVHAIGAGLVLCEIQQHSDVTYRLYDYGRGRELHLDKGLQIASIAPAEYQSRPWPVTCAYFHTELVEVRDVSLHPTPDRFQILIAIAGAGKLDGQDFQAGEAFLIPAASPEFLIESPAANFLQTWVP